MPSSDKAPKIPLSQREAKLAEALRANLRRRKAGATPVAADLSDGKSEGEA
jgi:hypothetical protein